MNFTSADGVVYPASYWRVISVSFNSQNRTANIHYQAWKDIDAYWAEKPTVLNLTHDYTVTDPEVYNTYLGDAERVIDGPFLDRLDDLALATLEPTVSFFDTATRYSLLGPVSLEIGADVAGISGFPIIVTFSDEIYATTDFNVATILVNAGSVGMTSQQPADLRIVYYEPVGVEDANDIITWAYVGGLGLKDANDFPLTAIAAQAVRNLIGSYLQFNHAENSAWI